MVFIWRHKNSNYITIDPSGWATSFPGFSPTHPNEVDGWAPAWRLNTDLYKLKTFLRIPRIRNIPLTWILGRISSTNDTLTVSFPRNFSSLRTADVSPSSQPQRDVSRNVPQRRWASRNFCHSQSKFFKTAPPPTVSVDSSL